MAGRTIGHGREGPGDAPARQAADGERAAFRDLEMALQAAFQIFCLLLCNAAARGKIDRGKSGRADNEFAARGHGKRGAFLWRRFVMANARQKNGRASGVSGRVHPGVDAVKFRGNGARPVERGHDAARSDRHARRRMSRRRRAARARGWRKDRARRGAVTAMMRGSFAPRVPPQCDVRARALPSLGRRWRWRDDRSARSRGGVRRRYGGRAARARRRALGGEAR